MNWIKYDSLVAIFISQICVTFCKIKLIGEREYGKLIHNATHTVSPLKSSKVTSFVCVTHIGITKNGSLLKVLKAYKPQLTVTQSGGNNYKQDQPK